MLDVRGLDHPCSRARCVATFINRRRQTTGATERGQTFNDSGRLVGLRRPRRLVSVSIAVGDRRFFGSGQVPQHVRV
jgi:hypothetical protein